MSVDRPNALYNFLPPNVTSLIQPMDQGPIRSLKCIYKVCFLEAMVDAATKGMSVSEFQKSYTPKDAVFNIYHSWQRVSCETLKKSWHKLCPPTLVTIDEVSEDEEANLDDPCVGEQQEIVNYLIGYLGTHVTAGITEDDMNEVLACDTDAPVTSSYTDDEILHMALGEVENDDYYDDQPPVHVTESVHIDDIIELCDKLIIGLEQKDYVSDLEILSVYTLRDKIRRQTLIC